MNWRPPKSPRYAGYSRHIVERKVEQLKQRLAELDSADESFNTEAYDAIVENPFLAVAAAAALDVLDRRRHGVATPTCGAS